jgi:hypothetical protein
MKITIEINKHFQAGEFVGWITWIHTDGKPILETLVEPAATPEEIAMLVAHTLLPEIQKETNQ